MIVRKTLSTREKAIAPGDSSLTETEKTASSLLDVVCGKDVRLEESHAT
jgi:hypothetical protein